MFVDFIAIRVWKTVKWFTILGLFERFISDKLPSITGSQQSLESQSKYLTKFLNWRILNLKNPNNLRYWNVVCNRRKLRNKFPSSSQFRNSENFTSLGYIKNRCTCTHFLFVFERGLFIVVDWETEKVIINMF